MSSQPWNVSKILRLIIGIALMSLGIYLFILDGALNVVLGIVVIIYGGIFVLTTTKQLGKMKRIVTRTAQ